jgi:hypothetical protein
VSSAPEANSDIVIARHLRAGWWGLAVFVVLGAVLEVLHAIKAPTYVDAGQETTRLLLRLAHAHGTLLALVNVAFALTLRAWRTPPSGSSGSLLSWASACLLGALVLLPGGFLLGGLWAHGGDPGLGVLLVPVGALGLFAGAVFVARSLRSLGDRPADP